MNRFLIPLGVFLLLAMLLGIGLTLNPREVPSPLIDKPAPVFSLPTLRDPQQTISADSLQGQVWLFNVFASWCTPCLEEHPHLMELAEANAVPIYGLNYKDSGDAALKWLVRHGDPYTGIVTDPDGRIGIDYGVYGVPETFVIDKQGVIRFKHVGPMTPEVIEQKVMPLVRKLQS
jgi:cytochrome c biogenesis protein CcmG, thiol:disulfide interchange protein DsbE